MDDFKQFSIEKNLVRLYTAVYWQYETTYQIPDSKTIKAIQEEIGEKQNECKSEIEKFRKDYVDNRFPQIFPENKFQELNETKKCAYCHITVEKVEALANKEKLFKKNLRGWSLEIDRKNSNYEYCPNNCIMACYWCNNAKTDEFTHDEFIEIGKAFKQVWEERLQA